MIHVKQMESIELEEFACISASLSSNDIKDNKIHEAGLWHRSSAGFLSFRTKVLFPRMRALRYN